MHTCDVYMSVLNCAFVYFVFDHLYQSSSNNNKGSSECVLCLYNVDIFVLQKGFGSKEKVGVEYQGNLMVYLAMQHLIQEDRKS